jgi:hypothetical protein
MACVSKSIPKMLDKIVFGTDMEPFWDDGMIRFSIADMHRIGVKVVQDKCGNQYMCLMKLIKKSKFVEVCGKIRTDRALVLDIRNQYNVKVKSVASVGLFNTSHPEWYNKDIVYAIGEIVIPNTYDESDEICSSGIHFFSLCYNFERIFRTRYIFSSLIISNLITIMKKEVRGYTSLCVGSKLKWE